MTIADDRPGEQWSRLSVHTVTVNAVVVAAVVLVTAAILLIAGVPAVWVLPFVPVALLVIVIPEFLRWQRASYRLTEERLELRTGILVRAATSVPRDRIRSVDVTADPVSRIFRIAVVKVGTGTNVRGGADELKLDSLPSAAAEQLREELLRRDLPSPSSADSSSGRFGEAPAGAESWDNQDRQSSAEAVAAPGARSDRGPAQLARLDPGWVRYAPVGVLTPVLGAAAIGGVFQVGEWFQRLPWEFGFVQPAVDVFRVSALMVALGVLLALLLFLVAGAIGATAVWLDTWWNYRLEYRDGVFRVRRGLLTTRSISFEEARLRGVELVEAVTLRRLGVGQPNVVATGMETRAEQEKGSAGRKALMPPVPLVTAHTVIAQVLDEERSPLSDVRLVSHPKAARRRRLIWSLTAVTALVLPLLVIGLWVAPVLAWIGLVFGVLGYAVLPLFAVDAYRNLGHALSGRFLVSRHGTVLRRTVALQRSGVIGWKVRQSFFQRRAGIANVTATTAAGGGKYAVYDAELGEGLDFADAAVPGLLVPFLQRPGDQPGDAEQAGAEPGPARQR